jgi:hypothetical protein
MSVDADFTKADVIADPFPLLHALMEHDPVHRNPRLNSWCLTRHADVIAAYKDPRFSANRVGPALDAQGGLPQHQREALGSLLNLWLVFTDPPTHGRLRKLLNQGFTRRAVLGLRPAIAKIADTLLDAVIGRGEMDMVADFAYPLPALVIADILGVPREDVDSLKRWSDALGQFVFSSRLNDSRHAQAAASAEQMYAYFAQLIERRRRAPGEAIIDRLIAAHEGDDRLSLEELVASCALLLFAGHETTTQLFGNGTLALLANPGECEDLSRNPADAALVENAVEEMLRWDGPTLAMTRLLKDDVEMHGRTMRAGERVFLFNAAAGRDPRVFADPDRFHIRRENARRQVNFGFGIHLCLGAQLARLEAQTAFPLLLARLGGMRCRADTLEWSDSLVMRGVKALPLAFDA